VKEGGKEVERHDYQYGELGMPRRRRIHEPRITKSVDDLVDKGAEKKGSVEPL